MNTIKCPQCNLTNWATAISCKRCGNLFQNIEPNSTEHTSVVNQSPVTNFGANPQNLPPNNYSNNYSQSQNNWNPQPKFQNNYSNYQQNNANQKSGLAITSMVLGIVGFVLSCVGGFLLAPFGLIFGIVSLVKANKRPQEYGGKGFAIAGTVLNSVLVLSFPIILAIAIPNILAARRSANEGSAIASLRTIHSSEIAYQSMDRGGNFAELSELSQANMLEPQLGKGQKNGYKFVLVKSFDVNNEVNFEITAVPLVADGINASGLRSFYINKEGVIHAAIKKGLPASANDPPLDTNQTLSPRIAQQR